MDKITDLRQEIDAIDGKIMELLDKRFFITKAIGEEKKSISRIILDETRQETILSSTSIYSHSPQIKSIYEHIMKTSRSQQGK